VLKRVFVIGFSIIVFGEWSSQLFWVPHRKETQGNFVVGLDFWVAKSIPE
jgi:hypothetical protein